MQEAFCLLTEINTFTVVGLGTVFALLNGFLLAFVIIAVLLPIHVLMVTSERYGHVVFTWQMLHFQVVMPI